MVTNPSAKRQIDVRLVHNGVQPGTALEGWFRFGVQDCKGEIHPGITRVGEEQNFDLSLEIVKHGKAGQPVFRGAFVHELPAARFLYLSWKREGDHEHPCSFRIKIPLSGIGWTEIHAAEEPGKCLVANVIGRRLYASEIIQWRLEASQRV